MDMHHCMRTPVIYSHEFDCLILEKLTKQPCEVHSFQPSKSLIPVKKDTEEA